MFKVNELLKAVSGKLINPGNSADVKGISIDTRTIKPLDAFLAMKGDNFDGHDFIGLAVNKGAGCIIIEKGKGKGKDFAKTTIIEVKSTVKALGDIAGFHRRKFDIPVIAVTGSNGKTTVKEMIGWILSEKLNVLKNEGTKNNHIGLPLALLNLNARHDIVVVEIGTNHFGEVEYLAKICQANIGLITNIGPSHLEYFKNLEGVLREKYALIRNLKKPHIAVLNGDDGLLRKKLCVKTKKPFTLSFGIESKCDFFPSNISNLDGGMEFTINAAGNCKFRLNTLGYHNIYNALSAISIGRIFGMPYKDIARRLNAFEFPPGRLKIIRLGDIKFIDDTYNSNPLSLKQALNSLYNFKNRGRKIFLMGDMRELGSRTEAFHRQAGREAARSCDILITVGELSRAAANAARKNGLGKNMVFSCCSCREAKEILYNDILPAKEDVILVKGSRSMKMEEIFKV